MKIECNTLIRWHARNTQPQSQQMIESAMWIKIVEYDALESCLNFGIHAANRSGSDVKYAKVIHKSSLFKDFFEITTNLPAWSVKNVLRPRIVLHRERKVRMRKHISSSPRILTWLVIPRFFGDLSRFYLPWTLMNVEGSQRSKQWTYVFD